VPPHPKPLARVLLLLALVGLALAVRGPRHDLVQPTGLAVHDLDTMRRLARLSAIDRSDHYPIVEPKDGWPAGTTLHWTLPMDWVIRGLDPLARAIFPGARPHEAGAVLAGPVLAAAAVSLFAWLAMHLLGPWPGFVAAALYALWYPFVNTSLLGNGDHQTLQQAAGVVAVLGLLRAVRTAVAGGGGSRAAAAWAAAAGAALGFAVWVSTELMLLFYAVAAALVLLASWPWRERSTRAAGRSLPWPWSVGVLVVVALGHLVEHGDDLSALRWDSVSWFQIWQVAVFAGFAASLRLLGDGGRPGAVVGLGGAALALGCTPLLVAGVRDALSVQLQQAREVSVWLHSEVSEFRSLCFDGTAHGLGGCVTAGARALFQRDGPLAFALPLALLALPWSALGAGVAGLLGVIGLLTAGLYAFEVKLGHLFALVCPLTLVAGWMAMLPSWRGPARGLAGVVAAAAAVVVLAWGLPGPLPESVRNNDLVVREVCAKLAARRGANDAGHGVLAPWDMGAPLMYLADVGVVASGYHRNLEGIRDGFRFWLTDVADRAAAMAILQRRRVRWVVAWYDRLFLKGGAETIGREPLRTDRELLPQAARTMFWQLRYGSPPGFRLVEDGPLIRLHGSREPEPIYRLWEVVE